MSSQGQPTPPSSHSSTNGASPSDNLTNSPFRVVRKRNRIPLSCAPCRHRKLKCNRGHPCDNCTKRGDIASCNYAAPGNRKRGSASAANATPDDMQNRIDRLEGLVLTLMTGGGATQPASAAVAQAALRTASHGRSESISTGSAADSQGLHASPQGIDMITEEVEGEESEVENLSNGIGIMKMHGDKTIYASDAHWYAILGEISEVKKYFDGHKEDYVRHMHKLEASRKDEGYTGPSFLLQGGMSARDKSELFAAYPPKVDADRLIARYFNAYDPSVHIIHGPSFQKEYDRHWVQPADTSLHWLGLNFAMMTLALQSYCRGGDEPPEYRGRCLQLSNEYRKLTAQCIIAGDITSPTARVLETLVLHVQAEYGRSRDAEPGVLLLTSFCVRLAMRMGYHRDPGPHPAITPFQGEIRRRVWTFIRGFDSLISFQFGLPAMIRIEQTDTQPPRNLYDDELHEDMKSLPPSRQTFEATPMSYMITKSKMTFLFGRIVERSQSLSNPPSYEETLRADQELRELRAQHPPLLQMRSFAQSARDPANLIMQRTGLEMMFLRCLFVLHRRFISRGRENAKYAHSRRTCLDASMELLDHQATLYRESQPGGRLRSVKWYISSMTTHDFLLAAMLVCSDLHHTQEDERLGRSNSKPASPGSPPGTTPPDLYDPGRREQMLRAVEHCITIWESMRDQSMEAYKGAISLRVMVEKIRSRPPGPPSNGSAAAHTSHNAPPSYDRGSPLSATNPKLLPGFPRPAAGYGLIPNGQVSLPPGGPEVKMDDDELLPPEQSAAMTLELLSSGGLSSPPTATQYGEPTRQSNLPASMAGLLNEPMMPAEADGRTGLTPAYLAESGGMQQGFTPANSGALSPLSQMFAQGGPGAMGGSGFMGMDAMGGGDIDWGAWDSYIQGTTGAGGFDSAQFWPMNLDPMMDTLPPPQQQQQQQQQQPPLPQQSHQQRASSQSSGQHSQQQQNGGGMYMSEPNGPLT